jgi:hypothetical protein
VVAVWSITDHDHVNTTALREFLYQNLTPPYGTTRTVQKLETYQACVYRNFWTSTICTTRILCMLEYLFQQEDHEIKFEWA